MQPTSTPVEAPAERPLSGVARLALMASAAATIVLFYIFISITSAILLLWIGLEMLAALVVARVGLAGYVIRYTERHVKLLGLLVRGLWLRKGIAYRLKLEPADAPGVVKIMNELAARLDIPPPDTIFLEMNAGAWVELTGLRRNLGKSHVGIGYDLLAGLTEEEVEAVLAHELVHAKMVNRVLKRWLNAGLMRAGTAMGQVSAAAHGHRKANKKFIIAEIVLGAGDGLTRLCARMVSAYSRQDEFDADRGASELCGSAPLCSALQKLHLLEPKLARLPWNERVVHIQSPEGVSRWLVRELSLPASGEDATDASSSFVNKYSTHPSLRDRVAALPKDHTQLHESPPGIGLLAQPDSLAEKLVSEIEKKQLELEGKDLREVRRWLRKIRRNQRLYLRGAQVPGLIFGLMAGFAALGMFAANAILSGVLTLVFGIVIAAFLFRWGRYRDRRMLPIPDYAAMKAAWSGENQVQDIEAAQKQIELKLREKITTEITKAQKLALLVEEAYEALRSCDYLHAHVASRICIELDKKSLEGALALAISSAAYHQGAQCNTRLNSLMQTTRLLTPSLEWGAAWAYVLKGEWLAAEALLLNVTKKRPDEPTLLTLLALAQSRRGKLQSAVVHLRRVSEIQPRALEPTKLLVQLLLDRGDIKEAEQRLKHLEQAAEEDRELQFSMIRLYVLRNEFLRAEEWVSRMSAQAVPEYLFVNLGRLYEEVRKDDAAAGYYRRALEVGYYPEALLGLARIELLAKNKELARVHTLCALDVTKPLGTKARSAYDMFQTSIAMLLSLEEPAPDCKAWFVRLLTGSAGGPLSKHTFIIYSTGKSEAEAYLTTIARAMEPNKPPPVSALIDINPATKDMQPAVPVRPGVQSVYK